MIEESKASAIVIMTAYRPYTADTWHDHLRWAWSQSIDRTVEMLTDVCDNGILEPILVNNKGELLDGHRRVVAALALNIDVPVSFRYVP